MYLSVATYPTRRTPPPNPFSRGLHRPFSSLFSLFSLFPPSLSPVEPSSRGARKLERVGNNGRKEEKGHGKRNISRNVLPWSPFQLPSTLSHPRVTSFEPPFEGPSRRPRPTNHPPFAHSALHVFAGGWREGRESVEEASFLTGCTRRKGSREGRSVKGEWREGGRRRRRKEREMIIHSTVITQRATVKLTRQEIRPTDHPSFRSPLLHRLASSLHPSIFLLNPPPPPRKPRSGQLTPGYMQTTTATVPRASHKLTELYYADPLLSLSRPPFLLQIYYIPTSVQPPLQLAGIFVSLFSLPSSKLVRASPFFRNRGKGKILLFEGLF